MKKSDKTHWQDSVKGNAKLVTEELSRLQNSGRLAIHRFEEADEHSIYPTNTIKYLQSNNSEALTDLVGDNKAAFLSMTLIPTQKSKKSIHPYQYMFCGNTLGYVFDVSDEPSQPAIIGKAFPCSVNTGKDPLQKNFRMNKPSGIDELDDLDGLYTKLDKASLLKAVASDASLSGRQLDALQKIYEADNNPNVMELNEILVAATPKHVKAIFVPIDEYPYINYAEPLFHLMAALSGIEHSRKGINIPVVDYHIDQPHQGKFTYFAQGEEECKSAALKAIKQLRTDPEFREIIKRCKRMPEIEPCTEYENERQVYPLVYDLQKEALRLLDGLDIYDLYKPLPKKSVRHK